MLDAQQKRAEEQASQQQKTQQVISDAERRAQEAEQERQRALEAAQRARNEAERAVAEEHARLLGVAQRQTEAEADLARKRARLLERRDRTLGLRRKVRQLIDMRLTDDASADALYDELRAHLRSVRDELGRELSAKQRPAPSPGAVALSLPYDVDHAEVDRLRSTLTREAGVLRAAFAAFRETQLDQLNEDMIALNGDRLALLPLLSSQKRGAVTGFGPAGFDQAVAEARQVTLLARYHMHVLLRWVASLRDGRKGTERGAVTIGFVAVEWAMALALFFYAKRRITLALRARHERASSMTAAVIEPTPAERVLEFLIHVRQPLQWLLLVFVLVQLLPAPAQGLFEVDIASTVLAWTLGGSLVVLSLDAIAGDARDRQGIHAALRLRSLRLLGHAVVAFGLILGLSDRLVGKGTIYSWVFSTCWLAAPPLALLIVRWWRETIFERVARIRRKNAFHAWAMANQHGYKSLFSAAAAGVVLFVQGAVRAVRTWAGRFDLTRRAHAYLFRRGLDKLEKEAVRPTLRPLLVDAFEALSPNRRSETLIDDRVGDEVDAIVERITRPGGGVFAVVGERGAGKTTTLSRVAGRADTVTVQCPVGGLEALRRELVSRAGLAEDATLDQAAAAIDAPDRDAGLLIDDAHRLILPVMGGLAAFDHLIEIARRRSSTCTWVLAIDESVWRFFERARGARPLFDEVVTLAPWGDEDVSRLLVSRTRLAGLLPSFDDLVGKLPADADEIDREEALSATAAGYYRLLWDYAAGNPGVALHMWRRSLGQDGEGTVRVKVFHAPDTRDLEQLPDAAVFVLRAIVQLEPALPSDIARATQLGMSAVQDALRYGMVRGYFSERDGRYVLTWGWYRAITRYLQRRHLLATSS